MRRIVTVAVLGLTTLLASEAHALGPVDIEAAAKIGGGTSPFNGYSNPLGFGLGARGGIGLGGLYGGVSIIYYFGSSQNIDALGGSVSASALLYGIEGGYGAKLFNLFTLRGQLGLGNFQLNIGGVQASSHPTNLYLEPGLTALMNFGLILVGVDANILILPGINDPSGVNGGSSWDAAFTAHVQGGVKF
jgi:hypothetical protein